MTPEQRHMGRVAALGCCVCRRLGHGDTPAEIHHIRESRITRSDFLVLPVCREHHLGTHMSVHMRKRALMDALHIESEFDLLAETLRLLQGQN